MQALADTRPIGIGSMGAGASGMRGREPEQPQGSSAAANPRPAGARRGGGHHGDDPNTFGFAVWQLKNGEDKIISDRLVEIFSTAPKGTGTA
jgi:L-seryl-tRNA(Ser) seleniumtransferase